MKVAASLNILARSRRPVVLAAGFFDGVHLGHCQVLRAARRRARERRGEFWVLTFDRHPAELLAPDRAPDLLTTPAYRRVLIERQGAAGCVMLPFTAAFAALSAGQFFARLADRLPPGSEICVGANWRFGRGGQGNARLLARLASERGLRAWAVRPKRSGGATVSSTRIRRAVRSGRLAEAARLLGRPVSAFGRVVRGRGVGSGLGFPTANVATAPALLPPSGVYAAWAFVRDRMRPAVAHVGVCPTFPGAMSRQPALEVHLLDGAARLYGARMEMFFVARIRGERAFPSTDALCRRMARDAAEAARRLALKHPPKIAFTRLDEIVI